jgi:hypothetical protein
MVAANGWAVMVGPLVAVLAAVADEESEPLPQPDNSNDNVAAYATAVRCEIGMVRFLRINNKIGTIAKTLPKRHVRTRCFARFYTPLQRTYDPLSWRDIEVIMRAVSATQQDLATSRV